MDAGQSYLILGRTSGWNLSGSISDANASFWGAAAGDEAGTAVASGDFDGDGYYDFLIGAPLNDENGPDAGISYVAFGGECVDWDSDGASLCDDCDDQDVELNLLDVDEDGVSSCDGDCDDLDATIHPLAVELCDEADGDCDGIVPADEQDADGDGYLACEECDDSQPEFFPGGVEICDGQDNDCDGELPVWDQDFDGDGASVCEGDCDDADAGMNLGDLDGDGFSSCDGDCDEGDGAVFPGAVEVCDGIDGDCDGDVPEEEMDEDGDGMMPCAGDCDDQNPGVYSGGEEVCDGLDNDCNGVPDDRDVDGDGFVDEECGGEDCDDGSDAVSPGASEVCGDGLDNDCNGLIDEADGPCSGDDDTAADDDSVADDDDESPGESGCKCGLGGTGGRVSLGLFGLGIALLGLRFRRRWNGFLSLMLLSFCCAVLTAGCGTTECDDDDTTGDDDDGTPEPGGQIDSLLELDLGPVYLGETGSATLEIRNTGEQPLVVTDIFVSGSETDTFTIEFDQELEIVADSDIYYPLQVTFDPESAFRYKATLVVISSAFNAPPGAPHQVMLVGQGVQDQDGDGFAWGDGYEGQGADCDDENGAVNPDAQESCDGIDNDCDGGVDDVPDGDGDGVSLCDLYPDCDDTNPYVHPVWVDPDATGGNGTEDLPYGSIDDALGEQNCGFVLLREGRYFEGHRLEVTSAPLEIVSVDGPLAAEIHGSGNHGLFSIHAGPVAFSGLLFQGGHEQGQAGGVEASADISFDLCAFRYNESDADAGAVSVAGGELVIENSNLFMNRGSSGGGIFHDGSATGSGAEIRSCSFVANTGDFGAGAFLTGGEATVESSQFLLNEARYGGGAWIENATLASITASQFHGNATPAEDDSGGAGLVVADTLNLLVEGSLFSGNTSQLGGGALVYRTTGAFEGTSFQANQANFLGGALYLEGAYIEVSDCSFADNSAETAGGAVHARDDNILSLHRTTLLGNQAEQGGAIAVDSGSLSITNSVLDANGGDGAALYFDGATLSLEFTTLYDNQGPEDSAAVVLVSDPSLVDLRHSILADSVPAAVACEGESMAWDYNAYHSTLGDPAMSDACLPAGTGSMDADPWFIAASPDEDPYNDTLQLQAISPCIDAGDPTCLEADGTVCDMGAYGGTDPL